jgi:hypothetical protein
MSSVFEIISTYNTISRTIDSFITKTSSCREPFTTNSSNKIFNFWRNF